MNVAIQFCSLQILAFLFWLRVEALSSGPVPDIRRPSFGEDPAVAAVALMDSGEVFASQADVVTERCTKEI